MVVIFYGVFLVLLVGVFKTFKQQRLFTALGVRNLTRFYLANFLLPIVALIILLVLGESISDMLIIGFLHVVLGIFIYFMTAIFRQGLELQNEQDLTL
jgi:drug/metabolite transporter (DMT)-like permease